MLPLLPYTNCGKKKDSRLSDYFLAQFLFILLKIITFSPFHLLDTLECVFRAKLFVLLDISFFSHHLELVDRYVSLNFWFSIFSLTVFHLHLFFFSFFFSVYYHAYLFLSFRDFGIFFSTHLRASFIPPENSSLMITRKETTDAMLLSSPFHIFALFSAYAFRNFMRSHRPLQNFSAFEKLKWITAWLEIIVAFTLPITTLVGHEQWKFYWMTWQVANTNSYYLILLYYKHIRKNFSV